MTCRWMTLLALLLMSLWLLGGCGGGGGGEDVNPPPDQVTVLDTVTEEVPSSGGTVSSDAVATAPDVQFPSGVLSSDATVTMQVLSGVPVAAPNSGLTTLGKPVSVAVDGADLAADGHLILKPNKPAASGKAVLAGYLLDGQWVLTPAPEAAGVSPAVTVMLPSEAQAEATSAARSGNKGVGGLVLGFFEFPVIRNNDPMRLYKWVSGNWEAPGSAAWPDGQMTGSHQVLMVHGIFGTQDHFYQLARTLDSDPTLSVYAVRYSWGQHINVLGQKLAQIINQKVSEDNPIDIVAHSMGGLVSRSAIEQHNAGSRVRKLITCGSPHGGTPSAAVGVMFTSMVAQLNISGWLPEAWDLVAFSPFLIGLNQDSATPCDYKAMAGNVKTGSAWYFLNNLSYLGWLK
ncbi:MAG: esterase/lipase family protein, partial [Bacteroidota bacterium]